MLNQAFRLLNSFLLPVVAAFFLDPFIVQSYLSRFIDVSPFRLLVFFVLIPVSVYFYSGIYACLVEITSGEEMVLTFSQFKKNAKGFWKIYFLLLLLPFFVHLVLFIFLQDKNISLDMIISHLNIMILYLMAAWIIRKKYKPSRKKIILKIPDVGIIVFLYAANLFFLYLPQLSQIGGFGLARVSLFLSKYIHLLTFVYLSILILNRHPDIKKGFSFSKEVFLINPLGGSIWYNILYLLRRKYPPGFVVFKALTPKSYRIREFHSFIWCSRCFKNNTLVVIVCGCLDDDSPEAYKIAKEFKRRGSTVILSGFHFTCLPDEALEYAHSVIIGQGEGVWKDVIKDYENGSLKKKYWGSATEDDYREVHAELLNSPPEVIKDVLETTRGCKYRCHFCSVPFFHNGEIRKKPIHEIIGLIEKIKHRYKSISFIDDNIYNDPAYSRELFAALKPLHIKWQSFCTIDIANDDEALRLAKESGCHSLVFGYEISGDSPERNLGGKLALAGEYRQLTRKVKKAGIAIHGKFIFGFDSDSFRSLFELWRFCFGINPFLSAIGLLTPRPGTRLYYDMVKENRITNLNWRRYDMMHPVLKYKCLNNALLSSPLFFFLFVSPFLITTKFGYFLLGILAVNYAGYLLR